MPVTVVCCLIACAVYYPERLAAAPLPEAEKIFTFDDQYIRIEAGMFSAERSVVGVELLLTPKPDWKLYASNSSSIKPLRVKFQTSQCLKVKGAPLYSPPDIAITDDSGSYSEYFTKTASIRQEFSRLKCTQKNGFEGTAVVTYLLCQHNKCMGPFTREIRFKAPEK